MKEVAMPRFIRSSSTGFGFETESQNREFYAKQKKKRKEVIEEDDSYILFRTGDNENGWYVGYDKKRDLVYYAVNYKKYHKGLIGGQAVTQILVWRDFSSKFSDDITTMIFFNHLLPRYGQIMSDAVQTNEGAVFWNRMIVKAWKRGIPIGYVDFNERKVYRPLKGQEPEEFWKEHFPKAYGNKLQNEAKRFLIGKPK